MWSRECCSPIFLESLSISSLSPSLSNPNKKNSKLLLYNFKNYYIYVKKSKSSIWCFTWIYSTLPTTITTLDSMLTSSRLDSPFHILHACFSLFWNFDILHFSSTQQQKEAYKYNWIGNIGNFYLILKHACI
jgi:hypothetical protein